MGFGISLNPKFPFPRPRYSLSAVCLDKPAQEDATSPSTPGGAGTNWWRFSFFGGGALNCRV